VTEAAANRKLEAAPVRCRTPFSRKIPNMETEQKHPSVPFRHGSRTYLPVFTSRWVIFCGTLVMKVWVEIFQKL